MLLRRLSKLTISQIRVMILEIALTWWNGRDELFGTNELPPGWRLDRNFDQICSTPIHWENSAAQKRIGFQSFRGLLVDEATIFGCQGS